MLRIKPPSPEQLAVIDTLQVDPDSGIIRDKGCSGWNRIIPLVNQKIALECF